MQTVLRAANSTKEKQTFSLGFFLVMSDKYTVISSILGCISVGLNKRVSLLLKEDPALTRVPALVLC